MLMKNTEIGTQSGLLHLLDFTVFCFQNRDILLDLEIDLYAN